MEGIKKLIHEAIESIKSVMLTHQCSVSYSSGKDSSVVLGLVLQAAKLLKADGVEFQAIIVTHGDTTVENPELRMYADVEMRRIRRYGEKHGIPLEVLVAQPSLTESWQCRVIGGRALPSFPGMSHDCTSSMKISPMNRIRKGFLGKGAGNICTAIGTRFEESPMRAARMLSRGETPDKPWVGDDGSIFLSPIALWEMGDVWEYLGMCKAGDPEVTTFSNFEELFRIYADATSSSCAVVGDMASSGKSKPCGARTGCWCCTPAGRDKSAEAMIESDERYAYMRGLNLLQRFLVNTRWDFGRRLWLGRTLNESGYVAVQPDVYSPDMLRDLLRYCLTLDELEREASYALNIPVRFEIISLKTLLAIDAMWSVQGYQPAFEALRVYRDIVIDGKRHPVPEVEEFQRPKVLPKTRWLFIGTPSAEDMQPVGLRDTVLEAVSEPGSGCMGTRQTRDGRTIMDVNMAPSLDFDDEAVDMFFAFEFDRVLSEQDDGHYGGPTAGYLYYARMGMFSIAPQAVSTVDEILRRTWWKWHNGWFGQISTERLLEASTLVMGEAESSTPPAELPEPLEVSTDISSEQTELSGQGDLFKAAA